MLSSSSPNTGLLGARPWRSHQVLRYSASRVVLRTRCSSSGSGKLEQSRGFWQGLGKDAGVLLGTAAFCVLSGFAVSDFARAEANGLPDDVPKLPRSAIPDLSKKKTAPGKAAKSYKVPARILRAKANEKTLKAVLERIEQEPDNMVAYKALLSLRMENGEVKEAIDVLGRMIEKQPEHVEYRFMRARAYDLIGDVKNSRDEFQKLVDSQPLSARALQGLLVAMRKDGEDESKVIEIIHRAIKTAADQQQSMAARNFKMLLAQILTSQTKLEEALKVYAEVSKEDPSDFRPYLCQGLLYDSLGEKEKAKSFYKQYKQRCPESFPQRRYLDDLLVRGSYGARIKDEENEGSLPPMQQPQLTMQDMTRAQSKTSK